MKSLSQKVLSLITLVMLLPVALLAQPGGPNGGNGGNPDAPLDNPVVPFDGTMMLLFLLASVVFAVVMFRKLQKQQAAKA